MKKKDPKRSRIHLIIAAGITGFMILGYMGLIGGLSGHILLSRLLIPLTRLSFLILIGLFIGQIIESTGWLNILAGLFAPIFKVSRLGPFCASAFTTAFFSGTAANAMLKNFYDSGKIDRRRLFLSNLVNHLPAYFLHLPTTVFIVVPLTGKAGIIYFALTFSAVLLRTIAFLVYGRMTGKNPHDLKADRPDTAFETQKSKANGVVKTIGQKLIRRMMQIITFVLPIYTAVFLLNTGGFFTFLEGILTRTLSMDVLPIESLSLVILSFMAEFTSGFAAAGALIENGVLTTKEAVLALLIGNIVAFPIRALRHQLPRYMGIFSPILGTQLLFLGQGFRVSSLVLVGLGYYFFT